MRSLDSIVVVGAGAAGVAAAESLRREGYRGSLVLLGEEPMLPYDRPPLSKQVLAGTWDLERTFLRSEKHYADLDVRLLQTRACGLDSERRLVHVENGPSLDFDGLIIATGVRPRLLFEGAHAPGVHVLRDHADVVALRAAIQAGRRIVIVGAGFLGMEVAATARGMGRDVTVVDPLDQPMIRQVGQEIGTTIAALHRDHGVDLRMGVSVKEMLSEGDRVTAVALSDGTVVPADCVLLAVGAVPAVEWLRTSGLSLGDGIECDQYCRAAPGIYAAGDVASWINPHYQRRMRLEHRTNATEQANAAAHNLLHGDAKAFSPVPYFWTDQYDVKIQVHGIIPENSDVTVEEGSLDDGRFLALYRTNGQIIGALGWNAPRRVLAYRKILQEPQATR